MSNIRSHLTKVPAATLIAALFISALLSGHAATAEPTTCVVSSESDGDQPATTTLRGRIQGFNRRENRDCTELIRFEPERRYYIRLAAPLVITNAKDPDGDGDGVNLAIDGKGSDVVIDATKLPPATCPIRVTAKNVALKNLVIVARGKCVCGTLSAKSSFTCKIVGRSSGTSNLV